MNKPGKEDSNELLFDLSKLSLEETKETRLPEESKPLLPHRQLFSSYFTSTFLTSSHQWTANSPCVSVAAKECRNNYACYRCLARGGLGELLENEIPVQPSGYGSTFRLESTSYDHICGLMLLFVIACFVLFFVWSFRLLCS